MARRKPPKPVGLRLRSGIWHIQLQTEGGKLYGSTGCREEELEQAEKILRERIDGEQCKSPQSITRSVTSEKTYGEICEEYLESATHATQSDDFGMHFKLVTHIKDFADIPLQRLNRNHIKKFLQDLKVSGRSNRTLNKYIAFINKIKKIASTYYQFDDGTPYIEFPNLLPTYCKANGHLYGVAYKEDERQPIILNDEQIGLMFSSFHKEEFSDLILFLLMTGARAGEVLGLRWNEEAKVDQNGIALSSNLHGRIFKIGDRVGDNKGNGRRFLILNNVAKEVLDRQRGKDSEFCFTFSSTNGHPGRHLSKHSKSRLKTYTDGAKKQVARNAMLTRYSDWKRAKKKLGLPIIVKDLRSTFATRLRDNDIHLYDEKDTLGHKVQDVTRKYAQANWLKLVDILNGIFPNDPRRSHLKVVNG